MKLIVAFAITFWLVMSVSIANGQTSHFFDSKLKLELNQYSLELPLESLKLNDEHIQPKHLRLKVALLTIFLGHFGVHRIYLGTSPNVPVVYSLTLGGGLGILPFIDLIAILTTSDLEKYRNSNKVFMWN